MPDPKSAEDGLFARLQAVPEVTALVAARVYPDRAPDAIAGDYIVYQLINGDRDQSHESSDSLSGQRFQFDCISLVSAAAAKAIAIRVKDALHGYQGTPVLGGVRFDYINAFDGPSDFSETTKAYRRIVEIDVMFAEP